MKRTSCRTIATAAVGLILPLALSSVATAETTVQGTTINPAIHARNVPGSPKALLSIPLYEHRGGELGPGKAASVPPALTARPAPENNAPFQVSPGGFDAMPYSGFLPPDPILAVGPSEPRLLTVVNGGLALYNGATGTATVGPISFDGVSLYGGNFLGGPVSGGQFAFDPKVLYDPHSGRFFGVVLEGAGVSSTSWIRLFMSRADSGGNPASNPDDLTLAAATATPGVGANSWVGWNIDADSGLTNVWADYPSLGVDDTNIYITANMFGGPGNLGYKQVRVWVIPKSSLTAESVAITATILGDPAGTGALVEATFAAPVFTLSAPIKHDAGGPYHLVSRANVAAANTFASIDIFNVDPATRALTNTVPTTSRQAFAGPWGSFTTLDAPQPTTSTLIDTGDSRCLGSVVRGGRLWITATNFAPDPTPTRTETFWAEIDPTGVGVPTVSQSGVVAATATTGPFYWHSNITVDGFGDAFLVMATSSNVLSAGIAVTGRDTGVDAAGTMQTPTVIKAGNNAYVGLDGVGRNRWGDFAGIGVEPGAFGYVWVFHEYAFELGGDGIVKGNERWNGWAQKLTISAPVGVSFFTLE